MSVQKYAGAPWLYDESTGDIVGIKDPDGSEYYFVKAHGIFADTTDQTASINTATVMTLNTTERAYNVSLLFNSRISVARTGVYDLQFSAQFVNTDSQEHDVSIWLKKNGEDLEYSNSIIGVPSSHGGLNGHAIAAWNWGMMLSQNDYIQIYWSTPNAAVSIQQIPAQTSPVRPITPSIIATMYQVA